MIILEKPYVSDFLQQTVARMQVPVLSTSFSESLPLSGRMNMMSPEQFFERLQRETHPMLYSNSENSVALLNRYCPDHPVTKNVNYFKDKSRLREIFSALNPDVWHKKFTLQELLTADINLITRPFIVKPVRGFASIGIHAVHPETSWEMVLESIVKEVKLMEKVFPDEVVSLNEFLIESYIDGTEIAIDAYFNREGHPVILNILTHLFSSESDTSDRLYLTSGEIIEQYHQPLLDYLMEVGRLKELRNFPFHLEMRQRADGTIVPIEINPMRFMGFCVADVEYYFYGINPYEHFFLQKKPDWKAVLHSRKDSIYGMFGIDIPKHLDKGRIIFNYEKFIGHFSNPLHHVRMDYRIFPMAIYLFAETRKDNFSEFEAILHSDLTEFIEVPG